MAETEIEWTDATWNPVAGCSILSAGCKNCYAMKMAHRLSAMGLQKYEHTTRKSGNRTVWSGKIFEDHDSLNAPVNWKKPKKIFVNSMSDLFHHNVSDEFILKVWEVMTAANWHNYQILTKRPERMAAFLTQKSIAPSPHIWLGTSVEDATVVDRINYLRQTPAAIRFISFEPLIGPVGSVDLGSIDWAIVGGESGASARPIREDWIDEIYERCQLYGTAFFFKQWGAWGKDNKRRSKKANGREYRGKHWDEMPVANPAT